MDEQQGYGPVARGLIIVAAVIVVVAGMKAAAGLVVPLLLALFLAIITTPIFVALRRQGLGNATVLLVMIAATAVLGFAIVVALSTSLQTLTTNLPEYQQAINNELLALVQWLQELGLEVRVAQVNEWLRPEAVMQYVGNTLRTTTSLMGQSLLIFIVIIFMWLEALILPDKIERMVEPRTWSSLTDAVDHVRRYVGLKTVMSLLTGVLAGGLCAVMGIHYALLWGVAAFFLNFVPTIGSIVAAAPPIFLALVQHGGGSATALTVGYVIINVGVSNGLEPRFMGRGLGLSPLVVVLSMIVWGWVLGPIGMFLSVPLTTAVKISLQANEETRWIAVLLGGVPDEHISVRTRRTHATDADA